ncbi:MAG: hypothetical protein ACREFN_10295 [Acetobacteraceae bacterium]
MKAEHALSTSELQPAIARMRQIVAETGDHLLLGDGAPHPDAKLLDLCGEALHHLTAGRDAYSEYSLLLYPNCGSRADKDRLLAEYYAHKKGASGPMLEIRKLKAATAAGIYAKALVVRCSRSGAAGVAMTLADDLVNNPALRAILWGDDPGPEAKSAGNVVALELRARRRATP